MKDNFIQLNKSDILHLPIITSDGKDTGEYLEFDLEDIELLLKYQELIEKDKKNRENLNNKMVIISKRQDVKGKKLLSKNQEDQIKAVKDFFEKETEIYNMFLGKNGVQKLLNGRSLGWTSLKEIDEIIINQILPKLEVNTEIVKEKITKKYGQVLDKNEEIEVVE